MNSVMRTATIAGLLCLVLLPSTWPESAPLQSLPKSEDTKRIRIVHH